MTFANEPGQHSADQSGAAMLFSTAVDEFVRFCAIERQLSEHTVQAYACDLADLGKWLPVRTALTEITTETLKAYLEAIVSQRKRAPATVRRRFACFHGFFRHFQELGLNADPFAGWRLKLARRKRLPRALLRTEMSLLLSVLGHRQDAEPPEDTKLRVAVGLMISTGLRVGELCKLRIEDISPDGTSLRIQGKGSRDRIAYIADVTFRGELCELVLWNW